MDKIDRAGGAFPSVPPDPTPQEEKVGKSKSKEGEPAPARQVPMDAILRSQDAKLGLDRLLGLDSEKSALPAAENASKGKGETISPLQKSVQERLLTVHLGKNPTAERNGRHAGGDSGEKSGSRELGFDEARLAGNLDLKGFLAQGTEKQSSRERFENQPTGKNPFGPGVNQGGEKQTPGNAQFVDVKQFTRDAVAGMVGPPPGADVAGKINQLVSGEAGLNNRSAGTEKARHDDLRGGATGNALLDSANNPKQGNPATGKNAGGFADSAMGIVGEMANQRVGRDSVAADSMDDKVDDAVDAVVKPALAVGAIAGAMGAIPVAAAAGVFAASLEAAHAVDKATGGALEELGKDNVEKKSDILLDALQQRAIEDMKLKTGSTPDVDPQGQTEAVAPSLTGQSVEPDADYLRGVRYLSANDQDRESDRVPVSGAQRDALEAAKAQLGIRRGGSGDVDPTDDAGAAGPVVNDPQTHLTEMGQGGLVGQPDTSRPVGGGSGSAGTGQSGGEIDYGPDSAQQGYAGGSRTEEPGDVDFNVGGAPLSQGVKSSQAKEEEESVSTAKKRPRIPGIQ